MDSIISNLYRGKKNEYYQNIRVEVLPLLPPNLGRVMEVGCGEGHTLHHLKAKGLCEWTCGVELFSETAERARERVDLVFEGNIETIDVPVEEGSLDAILCLDVLEHLVDPWAVLRRLRKLLKPGGILIACIPNVRYLRVVIPLCLFGKWDYVYGGVLDKSHLRFFTRDSAIRLIECSGLNVDTVSALKPRRSGTARNLLRVFLGPFSTPQYLIRAKN